MFGEPHDQGLVFKWGSLVGIRMPSSGANGSLPFVATDVVFRPKEFTSAITSDWATVPWCTSDFAPYGDKAVDHLNQIHNTTNFAKGIGDICRYMGVVDNARWRMPTAAEWTELYGSDQENKGQSVKLGSGWVDGNYYPLSGQAMGPNLNNVAIIGNDANARVSNGNPYNNGSVFLPASGHRTYTNGAIWNLGAYGYYWSSAASSSDDGYDMRFTSSAVLPQQLVNRSNAFSVRCIRE